MKPHSSIYLPAPCTILDVADLTPTEKLFRVSPPNGCDLGHKPGQFVQVSVLGAGEAPISVASSPTRPGHFDLGIRRTGTVTSALHRLKAGDEVGIRGPFGTCFDITEMTARDLILIAGGCGLAPMRSLIQYCEDRRSDFGRVTVIYGAKSPQDVLFKDEVAAWAKSNALDCLFSVDAVPQGTCYDGNVGLVTTLIPPLDVDPAKTIAVIVGPPVMYKFVIAELKKKGLPETQMIVSLERHMKCGVGKCGHCTIEHLYCCLDGPVFRLSDVSDLRGAI